MGCAQEFSRSTIRYINSVPTLGSLPRRRLDIVDPLRRKLRGKGGEDDDDDDDGDDDDDDGDDDKDEDDRGGDNKGSENKKDSGKDGGGESQLPKPVESPPPPTIPPSIVTSSPSPTLTTFIGSPPLESLSTDSLQPGQATPTVMTIQSATTSSSTSAAADIANAAISPSSTVSPAENTSPGSSTTALPTPPASIPSTTALQSKPNQLPIILGFIIGVLGLLAICLVGWFVFAKYKTRKMKRGSRGSSIQSSQDVEAYGFKKFEDEQVGRSGRLRESWTPYEDRLSLVRAKSTSSTTQTKTKKYRIVSMGGITHTTGTTSNTAFVVATPPTPHPGSQSNPSAEQLPSHQFYNPQQPTSHPIVHDAGPILREGVVPGAHLIFGHRNGH